MLKTHTNAKRSRQYTDSQQEQVLNIKQKAELCVDRMYHMDIAARHAKLQYVKQEILPALYRQYNRKHDDQEVDRLLQAHDYIVHNNANDTKLSEHEIKEIHRIVSGRAQGAYKEKNNIVASNSLTLLKTAEAGLFTDIAMSDLLDWFNQNSKSVDCFYLSIAFHVMFTAIHPFDDGNGRTARLLILQCLMRTCDDCLKKVLPFLCYDYYMLKNRRQYVSLLHLAANEFSPEADYDLSAIVDFILKAFGQSVEDFEQYLKS